MNQVGVPTTTVKKSSSVNLLAVFAATVICLSSVVIPTLSQALPIKYTTGIHFDEKEPQPTFYERTASIVYKYEIPVWPTFWLSPKYEECISDVYNATAPIYHCPVDFHQMKLTNQMSPMIHVQNMIRKSETRSRTAYNCDVIQPSFEGNYFEADDFEEFLTSLKICSEKYYYESDVLEDYVTFNISAHHGTLWTRYIAEFPNKFPQDEAVRLRGGALVIGTKIMHDALLFHHHLESTRWKDALSDCKSRLIPSTLVTQSRLNETLYNMAVQLDNDNLEFSIPPEYLSIYFDSPIADCVFTDDALVVHIQAPIKTRADWTLLNVRSLPFYNESICTVRNNGNQFIFDNKSRTAFATECTLGELCHVEEATERPYEKTCATATLLEEVDFIPTLCYLICQPIEYFQLPIFRKLASDRFVITGTPGGQFVIQCPAAKGIQIVNFPDIGAVEVLLPCGCDILYESVKISARHPCKTAAKADVFHLIPEHWTDNFN